MTTKTKRTPIETARSTAESVDRRLRRTHRLLAKLATDASWTMAAVAKQVGEFSIEQRRAATESGDCYDAIKAAMTAVQIAMKHSNRLFAKVQILANNEAHRALDPIQS